MTGRPRAHPTGRPDAEPAPHAAPGLQALLLAAVCVGILMLAIQLWLLTVSLDLYLGGRGPEVWLLALASGLIFAGGLLALRLLWPRRDPRR